MEPGSGIELSICSSNLVGMILSLWPLIVREVGFLRHSVVSISLRGEGLGPPDLVSPIAINFGSRVSVVVC